MRLYLKDILQTTTGKSSLQDVSREQLQQLTDAYPYFAAAQFLLAKKLHADQREDFINALQKTALHFDNTLLLHFNFFDEATVDEVPVDEVNAPSSTENNGDFVETNANEFTVIENDNVEVLVNKEKLSEISEDENEESADVIFEETTVEPNEKLSSLLKEQAEAFEKPVEETILPIEIVPHHRIDYFESQGIKLDPEKEANDKLATQLKRFTDWLKQMKRINPNLNNMETDAAGETQVQNMAEHSNETKEVLTETMAEVLIKQGKPDEAIHIYEKLSFSNPYKSAYFAAKIKELKPEQ